MIDIHCHALFGVDDGARTMEQSVSMLQTARANRITDIILTPHYRHEVFDYPLESILEHYERLEEEAERLSVQVHLGCEYYADSDMAQNIRAGRCLTLANSDYVLVEFGVTGALMDIRSGIDALIASGYKPVIAHAERYEAIRRHPEELTDLRKRGAWVQLNAGNVLGEEGRKVKAACKRFLRDGNVDVIASDAHNVTNRRCRMRECRRYIVGKYGKSIGKKLFYSNPERIIENA